MTLSKNMFLRTKNYICINITMLCLSLYVIFFPFFARILEKISPFLVQCVYKKMTGKECPLCGGTRYIANIKDVFNDITYLINQFGFMMMFIFFEVIFRIFILVKFICKKEISKKIIIFDIIIHIAVFFLFITYEIMYIMINK